MAETYLWNIPTTAVADVDVVAFVRTNLKSGGDVEKRVTKSGAEVCTKPYVLEAGNKDLPTKVDVSIIKRLPTAEKPLGDSTYAIAINTLAQIVEGGVVLQQSDASFEISWTIPGRSIITEAEILANLQALFSLVSGTFATGSMDTVNIAHLAYNNPVLFG